MSGRGKERTMNSRRRRRRRPEQQRVVLLLEKEKRKCEGVKYAFCYLSGSIDIIIITADEEEE